MPTDEPTNLDDTITADVIRSGLSVAVEEASIVVVRSAHSTFIQEGADACAALLDATGRLVAQSAATSLMHAASLRCSLPSLLEDVPAETMRAGDVFVLNDPYRGGIHANDLIVFRPILASGRVAFFAGTLVHVADVGGVAAGGLAALATDTFGEGLLLPPVYLARGGEPAPDLRRIVARNSRVPEKVLGDVDALVAGVHVVAARVEDLLDRYGVEPLEAFVDAWIAETERRMRAELDALPAGTYHGSFVIDGDGVEPGRTFDVRVAVTCGDGAVDVDFAGTAAQARGAINASVSQALSGVVYGIRCFVDPTIPMNEGCWRPITVHLPPGSLVNPAPPAACGGRIVTVAAAVEAILSALAAARPDLATAASGLIHVFTLSGQRHGTPWLNLFYEFGGVGARADADGPDATGCFFLGGRSVIPQVEPIEAGNPVVVRATRLRADSGGAGEWRGGLGVELELELLSDAVATVRGDRMLLPPPGAAGGLAGRAGEFVVKRGDGRVEALAAKQADVPLAAGDRLVVRTSGGGGLGEPVHRAADAVLADVVAGRVTRDAAARDYGVALDPTGARVDTAATDALRGGRRR
ncbi:MAG TPA: hydantoinase B/oxoprolinase family protein [Acidimicrobiia bacterium]|nr:hydantoinase B/oxoprolinase family protein [Acidimicrobiia bacterium]